MSLNLVQLIILKLDISIEFREAHPSNIECISSEFSVFQFNKLSEVNLSHPKNTECILFIFIVFQFDISRVLNERHPSNIE